MTDPERTPVDPAFDAQALACLPDVARFARSLTREASAADDLVQETYLRAYRSAATFLPGSDMRRWLFTICHHAWSRLVERERRVVLTEHGEDAELETMAAVMGHVAAQRSGADRLVAAIDVGPAIERAIASLSPALQAVVVLVDVQDLGYEEAASVLAIPVGTVRSRLFRARRLLQEQLFEFARDAGLSVSPDLANRSTRGSTP